MKSHTDLEMIAGSRGSMVLTPAAYTNAGGLPPFKSFRPSVTGVKITALKATKNAEDSVAAGTDMLALHITGSGATALEPPDLVICQGDQFTDITVTVGNVTIYF